MIDRPRIYIFPQTFVEHLVLAFLQLNIVGYKGPGRDDRVELTRADLTQADVTRMHQAHGSRAASYMPKREAKMATISGVCHNDPNFAVICSFLDRYSEMLALPSISYSELESWIEETKRGLSRVGCCPVF